MNNKINLILDFDPGHDDAIALMVASKNCKINLLGITVVSGNQTIEKVTRNALNLVDYLNIDAEVYQGVTQPLIKEVEVCSAIHGESGLDGFDFPSHKKVVSKVKAWDYIIDQCLRDKDITLVTCGPLTNIALALKLEPNIKNNIKEIVMMGGSMEHGNVTPAAEFNIFCDPEAAHIVFSSGINIKMIGLDVTRKVKVYSSIIDKFSTIKNNAGELFVSLMKVFNENQLKVFGFDGAPLHDPCTVVALLDKDVVKFEKMNVEIDISHLSSYGRTNCDRFDYLKKAQNAFVATDINIDKYWDLIFNHLKDYSC